MKARWLIIALALIAASSFALSVIAGGWWTIEGGFASIGPFGSRRCFGDDCQRAGLGWVGGDTRWIRIGTATWAAGLLAMLSLAALAAAVASKRMPRLLAKLVMSATVTAALAGSAFVALFPGLEAASLGRGALLYAIAIVLGMTAAILVYRARPSA